MADVPDGLMASFRHLLTHRLGPWLALLAIAVAAMVLGGMLAITYGDGNPVASSRLLVVDPPSRIIDRDEVNSFVIDREICAKYPVQVRVLREWTELVPDQAIRPTMAWSVSHYSLKEGCQRPLIRQPVPMSVPPGIYVFQSTLLAPCKPLGGCPEHRLQPIPLTLLNGPGWNKVPVPAAPPRPEDVSLGGPAMPTPPPPSGQ